MAEETDVLASAFDTTLSEFGLALNSVEARAAIGRFLALEFAGYLGFRPARRALAAKRPAVLDLCARELVDTSNVR